MTHRSQRTTHLLPQPHVCGVDMRALVPDHCHFIRRNRQRGCHDLNGIGAIPYEPGRKHRDQVCARHNLGHQQEVRRDRFGADCPWL